MSFSLIKTILTGSCVLIFLVSWYDGVTFPAWVPLIWCGVVFFIDLEEYLENR